MKLKIWVAIAIVSAVLGSSFSPVQAQTIYVNETGFFSGGFNPSSTPISSAIDNAAKGDDIMIRDGNYEGSVIVDEEVSIMSENGSANCIVDGGSDDVLEVTASGVSINGLSITGAGYGEAGVRIDHADDCIVTNCTIWDCDLGVYVRGTSSGTALNTNITNNMIQGDDIGIKISGKGVRNGEFRGNTIFNTVEGIELVYADENRIRYNNIYSCDKGLYLQSADRNNIINNHIHQNDIGIYLSDSGGNSEDNTITRNNIVDNEYLLYNDQDVEVNASLNFWNKYTNTSIDASIYDDDEEEGKGKVVFYPYRTNSAPVPELPTIVPALLGLVLVGRAKK